MERNIPRMESIQSISQRIWGKLENLTWIEILSIAIFGSVARQEDNADSDIDLLVIAEGISKRRIDRIPDMVRIERELDLSHPIDVLLVSRDECRSNFRNHNPLYLDIAFDAEIIYDDTNFLRDLMEETREYVKTHNIRRGDGSWSFPVKDRIPTELSRVTNREWSLAWLEAGRRDILAASYLLKAALFEQAVYHCQQAVEKGTKAILAAWGKLERTHRVANILRKECGERELGEWRGKLMKVAEIGSITEPHVSLSRYPELTNNILRLPYEQYNADAAKKHLDDAEYVVKTVEEFIHWWFSST
jgi:HEPN domain-containing protein/predicted nucleotidyltransferase